MHSPSPLPNPHRQSRRRHFYIALLAALILPILTAWRGVTNLYQPPGWRSTFAPASRPLYVHSQYLYVREGHGLFAHTLSIKREDAATFEKSATGFQSVDKLREVLASLPPLPRWSIFAQTPYELNNGFASYEFAVGLPLRWLVVSSSPVKPSATRVFIDEGSTLAEFTGKYGYVLVPRLVLSIVIVFSISFGLMQLPALFIATRRRIRIKRGLCPICAYPAANNTCPECGTATAST